MTKFKKLSCLLLTTAMFFACEGPTVTPPPPPTCIGADCNNRTSHYFEANVEIQKISAFPVEYSPVLLLQVTYTGSGTSNMISNVSLEASHLEQVASGRGTSEITEGQFVLNDESGNEIFGTYAGQGNPHSSDSVYTWFFQIKGGSGEFAEAQGTLTVSVTSSSNARITGNIGLPDQTES